MKVNIYLKGEEVERLYYVNHRPTTGRNVSRATGIIRSSKFDLKILVTIIVPRIYFKAIHFPNATFRLAVSLNTFAAFDVCKHENHL